MALIWHHAGFDWRKDSGTINSGLNAGTMPYLVFVSFIYNQGALVKGIDTFARADKGWRRSRPGYLYAEFRSPETTGPLIVLGISANQLHHISALRRHGWLEAGNQPAEILKAILKDLFIFEVIERLPERVFNRPLLRAGSGRNRTSGCKFAPISLGSLCCVPASRAGSLGAAIIAGVGAGYFKSYQEGVAAMVKMDRLFEPHPGNKAVYALKYGVYKQLYPLLAAYLRDLSKLRSFIV
jgi:hypothetical protein